MTKIAILEYSLYGHINQLSRSIKKGIESVGVEVEHLRCAETLPSEILEQMHAPPKPEDVRELTPANVNERRDHVRSFCPIWRDSSPNENHHGCHRRTLAKRKAGR